MQENRSLQPRTSLKQRIVLVFFGLFLFLVLLEVGLRLGEGVLLSIQEHRNLRSIKQKGAYRILCLGESTTQGQYPQFIEQTLNQRNIGVRFSVVDKGKPGTNTPTILSQIESYLVRYHPDMVVAMMGINDRGEHIPFEIATTSKGMLLIRSFKTYKLARLLWLHILTKAKERGLKETPIESIPAENDEAYAGLGWIYRDEGKFSQAENAFKKALALNPENDEAYAGLGWIYREQGKFSQAEDAFKKALALNPKNGNAYIELVWLYKGQGKFSQVEDLFKKSIELNPRNANAHAGLGWIYRDKGKFPQAEELFKKAIELNPKNANAYAGLGWACQRQGKFSQAEEAFKKSIDLDPKNSNVYKAISVLYEEMGKSELAKEYVQKADKLRLKYYAPVTANNYRKLKKILDKEGVRLVCVQYPMRNVEPLKKIFQGQDEGIIFVDNEKVFREATKKTSYKEYFWDIFAGDFGHCTEKGNRLLAQNIADVILKEIFNK